MLISAGNFGVILANLVESTEPEVAAVGQHVGFVHHRELAFAAVLLAEHGLVESETHAAFCTEAGRDHFLGGNFLGSALADDSAVAAV